MKVNLNIEEDEQFRAYVKDLIGGQVRAILRDQLNGVVAAEIAKLRLTQPNSPTFSEMVRKQVQTMITEAMNQYRVGLPAMIMDHIKIAAAATVAPYNDKVKEHVIEAIKRL